MGGSPRRTGRGARAAVAAALLATLFVVLTPGVARADSTVTQFTWSSAGTSDWVGQGTSGTVSPPTTFAVNGTRGSLTVSVQSSDHWSVTLAPPIGQQLAPGSYPTADRAMSRTAGHAGLDVTGRGHGCNVVIGSFKVNAISEDAFGTITMLDAAFTQYCESTSNAPLTGTIKYQAPPAAPAVVSAVTPTTVTGHSATVSANFTGLGAGLTANANVSVDGSYVGWTYVNANIAVFSVVLGYGTHTVTMTYPGDATHGSASGSTTVTVLDGATSLTLDSWSGDYIGQGASRAFSTDNATVSLTGTTAGLSLGVSTATEWWTARLAPPAGQQLAANTDYTAQRFADATHAALDVSGDGRGCNNTVGTFHITDLVTDGSGNIATLSGNFTQHCESATSPSLFGTFRANAGGSSSTSLSASPVAATVGQPVTLTATVGGVNPTGTVSFTLNGSTVLGSVPVTPTSSTGGTATLTTTAIPYNPSTQYVQATYSGDASNRSSVSPNVGVLVNRYSTTTALTASSTTTKVGQADTFTATVTGAAPTGMVNFFDGSNPIANVILDGSNVATFTTASLPAGSHVITASYVGDNTNAGSTSAAVTVTVNKWVTTTTASAATLTPKPGRTDEVTATVAGATGTPTGTMTFYDGTTVLGTYTMSTSSVTIAPLFTKGTHSVKAVYSGDNRNAGSTSNVLTITAK